LVLPAAADLAYIRRESKRCDSYAAEVFMRSNISVSFHGAAGSTTGSRHLVHFDDKHILLDCGLYQGRRKDTQERNTNFGFSPGIVHTVVLSHAHIDHSGNLPNLVKLGFKGPIYCTPATEDLCKLMLRDSAFIQEKDAEWLTRLNYKRKRREVVEPLYTIEDADLCLTRFRSVHLHQPVNLLRDIQATFIEAGHILGSAGVVLDAGTGDARVRLAFSGDIGRKGLPLLRDPEFPTGVDYLIMESTYGARLHAPISEAKRELRAVIQRVAARGGKIIVPSFSVERTQEIIFYLNDLYNEGGLPQIPIFVDSPLAINVTDVFRMHPECFDKDTAEVMLDDKDIFGFDRLTYVRDVEESKRLNSIHVPCMIISASGMCEAGRIRHHLRNSIEDPRNCILFVGYQAEGTLGRQIVERTPEVNIFGEPFRLRAEVATLNAMSGHADQNDLVEYARQVKEAGKLKKVFLVHGEPDAQEPLAARLKAELGLKVVIPQLGERHRLEG
jgi:metallo-beta-lactamase family protein